MLAGEMTRTRLQHHLTPARRKVLTKFWVLGVIIYDAIRAFIISETLSKYGVNGVWYFLFEISLSIPYALCSLKLVLAIVDRNKSRFYIFGSLTLALFFAPDIYVLIATESLTPKIYIIYGTLLTFTTSVATYGIVREVRKKRSQKKAEDSLQA